MSEGVPQFTSAEKEYEMDSHEVRAEVFAHDPVAYIRNFREQLLAEPEYTQTNVAFEVIEEFENLMMIVQENDQSMTIPDLEDFLQSETEYELTRTFFAFLKKCGLTSSELLTWIESSPITSDYSAAEWLRERGDRVAFNEVYGEEY